MREPERGERQVRETEKENLSIPHSHLKSSPLLALATLQASITSMATPAPKQTHRQAYKRNDEVRACREQAHCTLLPLTHTHARTRTHTHSKKSSALSGDQGPCLLFVVA